MPHEHDIEADWTLFLTCNYTCDYCFFTPEQLRSKRVIAASNAQWEAAFDATGLRWLIHLTGGEPSLHPEFVDLCERLTRRHRISLNTNLSHPAFKRFAKVMDPARVGLIHVSFHPGERALRNGDAAFAEHFNLLRERGFLMLATVVSTPATLAGYSDVLARLEPAGIVPAPKLLRGIYQGRQYPDAYSDAERAVFVGALEQARLHYAPLLGEHAAQLTINPFGDDRFLHKLPDFTGRMCAAGRRFVQITPRGEVQQCPDTPLGNLLDGSFARREKDALCSATNCHYWCLRHADMQESESTVAARRGLMHEIHKLDQALQTNALPRDEAVRQIQVQVQSLRRLIPLSPQTAPAADPAPRDPA